MKLPLFLTNNLKYPAGVVMFGIAYALYYTTNHHPIFAPRELPMTFLDEMVPFLPWTIFIYMSEYFYFTAIYIICKDLENLNKYLYSFFFTQALSCLIFLIYPTTYPRDQFPVPAETPVLLQSLWAWLRSQDAPTNCLPSLHVSTVYLSAFIFKDEQREKLPFFLGWATLIALSTLPTKQHYLVDVVTGLVLAIIMYVMFHRWMPYQRWATKSQGIQDIS